MRRMWDRQVFATVRETLGYQVTGLVEICADDVATRTRRRMALAHALKAMVRPADHPSAALPAVISSGVAPLGE
jgi:hypothetical protein